jgi:nucleotide-binding universal stress UspA family protein
MIKNILVPVDGSAHALRAIDFASDIAQKYDAPITLLQVMPRFGSMEIPEQLREYAATENVQVSEHEVLQSAANRILEDAEGRARSNGIVNIQGVAEVGDPARTIVDYAKRHDVDLIVMGARGLGDLAALLLGSVSHKVCHLAECNCVLVK